MTKKTFETLTKYQLNSIRVVGDMNIAMVGWLSKPWMIVEDGETFDEIKERNYIPIDHFRTREDLYQNYKKLIKNI